MVVLLLWLILLALSPVLALVGLLLLPIVWLLSVPFRLLGVSLDAAFRLIFWLIGLPLRVLGS